MRPRPRLAVPTAALMLALAMAGWAAGLTWLRGSYHGMYPATGVVAALADGVLRGQAPGHDDGRTLLAGYYFPPFAALVAAARATGLEWVDALRAAGLVAGLLVLAATAALTAALGAGRAAVLLAMALTAVAYPFRDSVVSTRSDLLAAAAALAGLAAWTRDRELRGWGVPAWAAASWLCKMTSVSVPAGVVLWAIATRRPAAIGRFGLRFGAAAAIGILLALPIHGPAWYADVVRSLFGATPSTFHPLRGPLELLRYLGTFPELLWTVAAAVTVLLSRAAVVTPARAFAAASLAIAAYVMTNFGAGPNHLVEPAALAAALAATWAGPRLERARLPLLLAALAVAGATWREFVPIHRHAREPVNLRRGIVATVAAEEGEVLTEDPLIALAAGRRPGISDPGALRALSLAHDPRAERVLAGITAQRWALIVLNEPLAGSAHWYETVHLGPRVVAALAARYHDTGVVDGYHLLRPRPAP